MDVTVLNFDNVYQKQKLLDKPNYHWVDLQALPSTNLFCEKDTLQQIEKKLEAYQHPLTLIGSGNYHYITSLFLSRMKQPFTLILFDHHTDTLQSPSEDLISCGSWVLEALQTNKLLKRVVIIGASEEAEHHVDSSIEGKVSLYSKQFLRLHQHNALKKILKDIETDNVYISVDKDVLDTRDALTDWDHGTIRLPQVLRMIRAIIQTKTVAGVDICGEYPISPLNEFEKVAREANEKNSYANLYLIRYISRWLEEDRGRDRVLHA